MHGPLSTCAVPLLIPLLIAKQVAAGSCPEDYPYVGTSGPDSTQGIGHPTQDYDICCKLYMCSTGGEETDCSTGYPCVDYQPPGEKI